MTALADGLQQAIAELQSGRSREAATALESICRMQAATAADWFAQGVAQHWLGRLDAALAAFDRALAAEPGYLDALNARGTVLLAMNRPDEARLAFEAALAIAPEHSQVLVNLGIVLEQLSRPDEALARYDQALGVDPSCYAAPLNASALLLRMSRPEEALSFVDRLVDAHPDRYEGHLNRAEALLALDRYADAQTAAERALTLAPTSVAAQISRAVALACQGWFDASLAAFRLARATDPAVFAGAMARIWQQGDPARVNWPRGTDQLPDPRVLYLARGAVRLGRCDWDGRETYLARMHQIVREGVAQGMPVCDWTLPFAGNWLPLDNDVRLALAEAVGRAIDRNTAPLRLPAPSVPRRRPQRLHLGYLTPDVRDHPNVSLTAPVLASHDRSRFEVTAYALNPRDEDSMAVQFRAGCDRVRECHGLVDAAVAGRIRDDRIDILVDLAGYTDMARPEIAALRPAPVNCAYLGHPGTTGGRWMDYRISDAVATPAASQPWWSEQLALLPRTMFAYAPSTLPDPPPDRREEGLPASGFVFCAFHTPTKIDPEVFTVWMHLLQRVPGSVLWLSPSDDAQRNLRSEAATRGVDPARLVFAQRVPRKEDHLNRQRLADLYLDTPRYNAHTTAVEALYAGVPVLTCPGNGPASSVAASIVRAAGLDRLIAPDLTDYEALALALATSPVELSALRQDWARRRAACPLFDPRDLAGEIERAYEHIWARYSAGLPPLGFQLDARSR